MVTRFGHGTKGDALTRDDHRLKDWGQLPKEFFEFLDWCKGQEISSYLEVGAREGLSARLLCEELGVDDVTIVDLPDGPWGRPETDSQLIDNMEELGIPYRIFFGDSKDPEIIEAVSTRRYDLVFIDGDHSYEGVKADYENYGPLGNIVVLHDVNQQPNSKAYGPTRLFNELGGDKIAYSSKGIGIISGT